MEEFHPNRIGKYNTDITDKYQFYLFDWLCSEKGKKKINFMNKKLATIVQIGECM